MCAPDSDSNSPVHDLSAVCCGLVPAIRNILEQSGGGTMGDPARGPVRVPVRVLVRRGIATELVNAFGSGGAWAFTLTPGLSADLAQFTPVQDRTDSLHLF